MSNKRILIFATNNLHKLEEVRLIVGCNIGVTSLAEIGFKGDIPEVKETLEENAADKAKYIYDIYKSDCFADDTGLEIDALQGRPGVYSARYAGEKCDFNDNMDLVLLQMKGVKNRKARFRTIIALIERGDLKIFEGVIEGNINHKKKGLNGFGYDPIFVPEGYDLTFAELTAVEKNSISHRAKALNEFSDYIFKKDSKA